MKICLIRLDKIGDLVSTLPVDQIPELAGHDVRWVISEGLGFIPAHADAPRRVFELSLRDPRAAERRLFDFLKAEKPDLAVVFYAPWWASRALWRARVPRRFGRRSWWHSYVFLNEGLRQSRSKAERHEADYNFELLLAALRIPRGARPTPVLRLVAPAMPELLARFSLERGGYYVVHPGMAGSAINWPAPSYAALIRLLMARKPVVLTGTASDEPWLGPLRQEFAGSRDVTILQDRLSATELLVVLANAAGVVAPSTGVVHLAASLGVPALGLYSTVVVQRPTRWAPRGPRAGFVTAPPSPAGEADQAGGVMRITAVEAMARLDQL